jgi:hypothetical protein
MTAAGSAQGFQFEGLRRLLRCGVDRILVRGPRKISTRPAGWNATEAGLEDQYAGERTGFYRGARRRSLRRRGDRTQARGKG